jgi:hypothetical protein
MAKSTHFWLPSLRGGALKPTVRPGKGLIQQGDQVVGTGSPVLGGQMELPVESFELVANRIHGSIFAQFRPVIKGIARDLLGIRLVGFDPTQGISAILPDQQRVDRADGQAPFMNHLGNRLVVAPSMLHDDLRFTVAAF